MGSCYIQAEFQSLIGIYGFSRRIVLLGYCGAIALVSIPDRDLWVFPPANPDLIAGNRLFQSLIGIYGFSRLAAMLHDCFWLCFNP